MYDLLTLSLAMVIFFGPLVSTISFGVRGYQQASQRGAHPMPFILFYSLIGLLTGGILTTVIFIMTSAVVSDIKKGESKSLVLRRHICVYFTGGDMAQCKSYYPDK